MEEREEIERQIDDRESGGGLVSTILTSRTQLLMDATARHHFTNCAFNHSFRNTLIAHTVLSAYCLLLANVG
jgi:hypothetical protein